MHVESGAPLDDPFQAPLLPTLGVPAPSALLASSPRGASCSKESSVRALVKGNNSGYLEAPASHCDVRALVAPSKADVCTATTSPFSSLRGGPARRAMGH